MEDFVLGAVGAANDQCVSPRNRESMLVGKQLAVLPWNLNVGHTLGRTVISDT